MKTRIYPPRFLMHTVKILVWNRTQIYTVRYTDDKVITAESTIMYRNIGFSGDYSLTLNNKKTKLLTVHINYKTLINSTR